MSAIVECGHCGLYHSGPCPRVKAIEYHPNGTVKRVEYHDQQPVSAQTQPRLMVTSGMSENGIG